MSTPSADDTRTLTELAGRVMRAIQTKDLETIKSLTAEDFIYRGADGTEANRDAFVASIAEIPGELTSVEADGMRTYVYGDTAVMAGLQRSGLKMTDGAEVTDAVYFTDVWQRRDGQWKMVFAFSSPAAPTEAPQAPEAAPPQQ
ncbi:nuclear transport factor 2 family protein [Myxococcus sp. AM009]|uniref:nuclear transport factor 2 family protein n=1 Tax=unclassified Myxococcus TaxID=2648731 RepID=UPI00159639F9|nr:MULTISPECIES: nuclear transport factor 2 family protein [unclassified Myxococcus]NVI99328.1 nuclear transport factor 2 family protein [Myxococcus sp. AM009]NVJ17419.1 nuclear transport factor 2 family protein [Myxococcus sp. AM010]